MKKVLIVSPVFPPRNTPDMNRVRGSLPHFRKFGWEPSVLCIGSDTSHGVYDPKLLQSVPTDVEVHPVDAWRESACRRFGFGQLSYRSLYPLYRSGSQMLSRERFDVVYFSTTVFMCFTLGAIWKRRFGCKIVYDMQDPWYSEFESISITTSGSQWKYRIEQALAKHLERLAMRAADHIISVSDRYVDALLERYSFLRREQFTTIPFGVAKRDFMLADGVAPVSVDIRDPGRPVAWVSVGRAGPDMVPVLRSLFRALAAWRKNASGGADVRLSFVGTNYAPPDRTMKLVEPLAQECGVGDMVTEKSERIPYFESIALYKASDSILLIGSIYSDYTASKLMTCVLSKKPILAIFHRDSLVSRLAPQFANIFLVTFADDPCSPDVVRRIGEGLAWLRAPQFDDGAVERAAAPWLAETLTERQCRIFDSLVSEAPAGGVRAA